MSTDKCSVLLVDDESYLLPTLSALLAHDFHVITADSAEAALQVFARQPVDILLTDQKMPRMTGTQLLEWVHKHYPNTIRILMTGYAELEDAIEAINRGHVYHYLLKPWRTEDLLQVMRNAAEKFQLERSREQLLEELQRLNTDLEERVRLRTQELEEANRRLEQRQKESERLALTDPLTGLLNRRAIDDIVKHELKRHARYRSPLALGIFDADHFKEINRQYLLPGGDQALIGLSRVLSSSIRNVDTVGRIGGEEFLVIAPETNLEGATTLGERIRTAVESATITYNEQRIQVTVSAGFAVADVDTPANYDQMKHVAAEALVEAKAQGRNRCIVRPLIRSAEAVGSAGVLSALSR